MFEDEVASAAEHLLEINVGTIVNHQCPIFLDTGLDSHEQSQLIDLLHSYKDCFARSYDEMPSLALDNVVHHITVKSGFSPIKQSKREFILTVETLISAEIMNLKEAKFIPKV